MVKSVCVFIFNVFANPEGFAFNILLFEIRIKNPKKKKKQVFVCVCVTVCVGL